MMQLGWFSTGRDKAARNLLMEIWNRKEAGRLDVEIPFVFCNWEPEEDPRTPQAIERAKFHDLVRELGIDLIAITHLEVEPEMRKLGLAWTKDHATPSSTLLEWREIYGRRVIDAISDAGHHPDVSILAGYMLIWSRVECEEYDAINLHPALPWGPTGTWQKVIWRLMAGEETEQGVMMHLVSPELDRGPPVAYCRFPITGPGWDELWSEVRERGTSWIMGEEGEPNPLFMKIRTEGERRELPLIAHTVGELASGRLEIRDKWPYLGGERIESGADLSELIDAEIARGVGT
jgi:phosphoribosylglycinamide formyltransferase-1